MSSKRANTILPVATLIGASLFSVAVSASEPQKDMPGIETLFEEEPDPIQCDVEGQICGRVAVGSLAVAERQVHDEPDTVPSTTVLPPDLVECPPGRESEALDVIGQDDGSIVYLCIP